MSKIYIQNFPEVLKFSGSVGAACVLSGSLHCSGYSKLIGFITSSGSCETGSGFSIFQSVNAASDWDIDSGSDTWDTSFSAACSVDVLGNAIRVRYKNGATTTLNLRMLFQLKPIG